MANDCQHFELSLYWQPWLVVVAVAAAVFAVNVQQQESHLFKPHSISLRGGTAAAVPPPFRPGNPAHCGTGSRPLVTPYYVD